MSDDEEQVMSEEEGEEAPAPTRREAADEGPSEAQLAMQRRRNQQGQQYEGLDDAAQEVLEANRAERALMEEEIRELRERNERRKREREEEERRLTEQRAAEDARRKAEEEERRRKKDEEEREKREARQAKMAEFEKWKQPPKANFVITKKTDGGVSFTDEEGDEVHAEKKSKEQIEAEKRAILAQRVPKLDTSDMDTSKLTDKAKELHSLIVRVESEKYDLEKRFKAQQYDMMDLAERARQMVKVGKQGMIKRKALADDETDTFGEKFAGCPSKIEMYSKYERQKDKREFVDRRDIFTGPVYGYPADRIVPQKIVQWGEDGLPIYTDLEGGEIQPADDEE